MSINLRQKLLQRKRQSFIPFELSTIERLISLSSRIFGRAPVGKVRFLDPKNFASETMVILIIANVQG